MMNPELDHRVDPMQYLRMIWRRKWIVVLCAVLVICGTLIRLEFVPDEYQSFSAIMVDDRQLVAGQLGDLMSGLGAERGGRGLDQRRFDEIKNRVLSRPFLERVVRLLRIDEDPGVRRRAQEWIGPGVDLDVDEAALRVAVSELRTKVTFDVAGNNVFRIWVTDSNPRNAQLLAKWISELYVDSRAQRALRELSVARDFGEQQQAIYEERLAKAEDALEEFDRRVIAQDISQGLVQQGNVNAAEALYRAILDEVEEVRTRSLAPSTALAASELSNQRRFVLDDVRVETQARGLASTLREEVSNRLISGSSSNAWPPSSGSYVTLRRGLLELVERIVETSFPDAPEASQSALERYTFTTVDRQAQSEAADLVAREIARFRQRQQSGPRGEIERSRLEKEVLTAQRLLESFQGQLLAADVNQAVTAGDMGVRIEILDPAQQPIEPSGPERAKQLLAAVLMGPFLGVAVAFLTEIADPTLRSLNDFARVFDGPLLGTTPLIMKSGRHKTRRLGSILVPAGILLTLALTVAFFVGKDYVFENLVDVERPAAMVDPEDGGTQ